MTPGKKYFLLIYFTITATIIAQNPLKILFIGNSLTYSNDLPGMLVELASAKGRTLEVDSWTPGGVSLRDHANNSHTYIKINEKQWDYVILQSDDITAFSDMYYIEINTINKLLTGIRSNCSKSKVIYQMIFGLENGVTIQGEGTYTYEEYINKIYAGTLYIANHLNLQVAPVGWAWKQAIEKNPNIDLFAGDGAHPALRGSYIGACVFYATIFGEVLTENSYLSTLSSQEAFYLQSLATETVINDLAAWNLVTNLENETVLPRNIFLNNNYPNPFNPSTNINYVISQNGDGSLSSSKHVSLKIYDLLGNEITTLVDENQSPGIYEYKWTAEHQTSGLYFLTLRTDNYCETKKMLLLK